VSGAAPRFAQMRLDRLLANMGYGSRKEVQGLARAGLVVLDGAPLTNADQKIAVTPDLAQRMTIQGRPLDPPIGMALMLNKPLGVTCSHKETGPLVYELLPQRWRIREPIISTVGRLDKETSGLLLMTDDGALLHRIISPKSHMPKRYRVTLDRDLAGDEGARFAAGDLMLEGEDKPLLPAALEVLGPKEALLTITEGRYHQVRRMFAAVGNHVLGLHRDRIGGLMLPADLEPGGRRLLTAADIETLFGGAAAA
jgi:16S rRNA pseudouridine516 synthase